MLISPHIDEIASLIEQQGVIAYPTEAIFGLGCDPQCEHSIQRILSIKQRSANKGLILIATSLEQLSTYIQPLSDEASQRIQANLPHAITWLVPAKQETSSLLTGEHDTLAIRLTQHPSCIALCNALGHPLISTSANPAGLDPAISIQQVKSYFSSSIDGILDTPLGYATSPSEIRDLLNNKRLR